MGWSIGYDSTWGRDIGYGVPAYCDHPDCNEEIDRGLGYVCGGGPYGENPRGEGDGCGLFFCGKHLNGANLCDRCASADEAYNPFPAKPDHLTWIRHKLTDPSWGRWRKENPEIVRELSVVEKDTGRALDETVVPKPTDNKG